MGKHSQEVEVRSLERTTYHRQGTTGHGCVPAHSGGGAVSGEEFAASRFEIAQEPADEVVLKRAIVETAGLQPEDLGVLAALLLRDPHRPSTMEAIRKDLAAQGWRMGKDRYNAVAARLTTAGHLSRISVYDEAAKRPTWVTRVFRNPANNAQYVDLGIAASSQLSAEARETRDAEPGASAEVRETRDSPGQSRNAGFPRSGSESRETRDSADEVSAAQGRNAENPRSAASPPLPPEGMGNPSPLPPTDNSRQRGATDGSGQEFSEPEKQAASDVLQSLPGEPWCKVGPVEADGLAPLLLERMAKQGWPTMTELPDSARATLVECLTANPGGIDNPVRILRTKRIPNLWRYRPTGSSSSSRAVSSSLPPWCGKCNQGIEPSHVFERMVPLPDNSDDVNCPDCHPRKVGSAAAN